MTRTMKPRPKRRQRPQDIDFGPRPTQPAPMDWGEFELLRQVLGHAEHHYPKAWLADALGVSIRTLHRYANGEGEVPGPVAVLMRSWVAQGHVSVEI